MASSARIVLYIALEDQAKEFKEKCANINHSAIEIAFYPALGRETMEQTLQNIEKVIASRGMAWTMIHLPSIEKIYSASQGLEFIKRLVRVGAQKSTNLIVIDANGRYSAKGRQTFKNVSVTVLDEERDAGAPFNKMLTDDELTLKLAGDANEAFAGMEVSSSRIRGMQEGTPDDLNMAHTDPFADFDAVAYGHGDPFAQDDDFSSFGFDDDLFGDAVIPIQNGEEPFAEDLFADASSYVPQQSTDQYSPNAEDPFADLGVPSTSQSDNFSDPFSSFEYPSANSDNYSNNTQEIQSRGQFTLQDILRRYGDGLSNADYAKLASMIEPAWDYTLENADGIGRGGLLGSKKVKGISQVGEEELASSNYIRECERLNGYYSPPNDSKIIVCHSVKGGSGKTTVSVMIATMLNWFLNPELMQRMTTSIQHRILIFSINEFDDIPTHGVGYEEISSAENDNDGKNITELIRRLNETNDHPMWDDISHCFVSTERNRVFYLPSLTHKERLDHDLNISAQDYKRVIECCSKFFDFIILDTPDIVYQEKNDLMNFAFSVADIICMIIEPDSRSTLNLKDFFDGIKDSNGEIPFDANKCLLVVNKYVENGNPYMPIKPIGQLGFEKISQALSRYFARFVALPFSQPRGYGNVLNGTDPKIKYAAAELTDDVLELIDVNDNIQQVR